jgi:protein-S-isoprenylcysteine O-methyltransferase Ste14
MDWGSSVAIVCAIVSIACFAAITLIANRHFVSQAKLPPTGTLVIVGAAFASVGIFLWSILTASAHTLVPLIFYGGSLALFLWTVRTTRQMIFRPAFANVVPEALMMNGPYRFVRHPFYLSYLLYHLANALATKSVAPWIMLAVMFLLYFSAARNEETFLAQGEYAETHAAYKRRTGMFFPRLLRHS